MDRSENHTYYTTVSNMIRSQQDDGEHRYLFIKTQQGGGIITRMNRLRIQRWQRRILYPTRRNVNANNNMVVEENAAEVTPDSAIGDYLFDDDDDDNDNDSVPVASSTPEPADASEEVVTSSDDISNDELRLVMMQPMDGEEDGWVIIPLATIREVQCIKIRFDNATVAVRCSIDGEIQVKVF